ncbi:hypothetical protein ABW20_dc0108685 [Dactylellina cionopaga]|nr:hypothetical protein ABW20_dc0108685 [Dactylellina cionopaga]
MPAVALVQDVVYTTSTTTITELIVCQTIQYTTTVLDYCPCPIVFSTATSCSNSQTCSTTIITTPLPTPTTEEFTIDLTVPLDSGDQVITLSRVGNTVGIGGSTITFNLSSDGVMRDVSTGDTVYVILPSGAVRKRFDGSVDLLIGTPPASGTTMAWSRSGSGELLFYVGQNSANPITLGFGVALASDGSIDDTVPIQMYDISAGLPSDIGDGVASQSIVIVTSTSTEPIVTITRTGSSDYVTTIYPSDGSGTITVIDYDTPTSTSTSKSTASTQTSTKTTPTYTITQYGSATGDSTTTLSGGIVYIITTLLQSSDFVTLYGENLTVTTASFDLYDPTITIYNVLSQYITTESIYGTTGYTSTPVIGSLFPTLTAIAQETQVTFTNTTYGPVLSTISLQVDSTLPTVTVFIQFTVNTTVTTTTYIWNQFPILTSTFYYTTPTATVLVLSPQYRFYTTATGTTDLTTTIGPNNPTATVSFQISPTTTRTLGYRITEWSLTTTSTETVRQTVGYTRTVLLHVPYPSASAIQFQVPEMPVGSVQYLTAAETQLGSLFDPVSFIYTSSTTFCKFIQFNDSLVLATNYTTGARLPAPMFPWGYFPLATFGSGLYFSTSAELAGISGAMVVPFNMVESSRFLKLNDSWNASTLVAQAANFWYSAGATNYYTPVFYSTTDATRLGAFNTIGTSVMSFAATAPTPT